MTIATADSKVTVDNVESVLDALIKSETIAEFCRAIVHSEFTRNSVQGCHFYSLDSESGLNPVSGYGLGYLDTQATLSAWDDDPTALSVRNKKYEFQVTNKASNKGVLSVPLLKDSVPVGAMVMVLDSTVKELPINESLIPILGKLGTYCLGSLSRSTGRTSGFSAANRESNGEDLTSRQIKILEYMAEGLVNVEIARELMLSESTIRQETVRIYRALGVPNRGEAAKKGKALGLIKKSSATATA